MQLSKGDLEADGLSDVVVGRQIAIDACKQNAQFFLDSFWTIATNEGSADGSHRHEIMNLRPFQRDFLSEIEKETKLLILKGRQIGFTEVLAAYMGWFAGSKPNSRIYYSTLVAKDAAKVVTSIRDIGYANLPAWMSGYKDWFPVVTNDHSEVIKFSNGSYIEVRAVGQRGIGIRGQTPSLVINDEFAKYKNPDKVLAAAEPAAHDGARIILCSTSDGPNNLFADEFMEGYYKNNSPYRCLFYGWQSVESRSDDWYNEQMRHKRSPAQRAQMAQEHPNDPQDAFLNTLESVFDTKLIDDQNAEMNNVVCDVGRLVAHGDRKPHFEFDDNGNLSVYVAPGKQAGMPVIGADVAMKTYDGDYSCAVVLDQEMRVCAIWHGRIDGKDFAKVLHDLGRWYARSNAYPLIAVESNAMGVVPLAELRELGYPKIYRRESTDQRVAPGALETLGWMTNRRTKPIMVENINSAINQGEVRLMDKELAIELKGFVRKPNNQMGGSPFDDRVMALGIAICVLPHATNPENVHDPRIQRGTQEWFDAMWEAQHGRANNSKSIWDTGFRTSAW